MTLLTVLSSIFGNDKIINHCLKIINHFLDKADRNIELKRAYYNLVNQLDRKTPIKLSDEMDQIRRELRVLIDHENEDDFNELEKLRQKNNELYKRVLKLEDDLYNQLEI